MARACTVSSHCWLTPGLTPTGSAELLRRPGTVRRSDSDRGRIARGLHADLVLVDGDPTTDINATRKIVGVWKQGGSIDRKAYRTHVGQQTEEIAKLESAPAAARSDQGLISDFEGEKAVTATASAQAGWSRPTQWGQVESGDERASPRGSTAQRHALKIEGTIDPGPGQHWAGVMFHRGRSRCDRPTCHASRGCRSGPRATANLLM